MNSVIGERKMILDFLKKYSSIVYTVFGLNLLSILLFTRFYLHKSILSNCIIFCLTVIFWSLLWILSHQFNKAKCENTDTGFIAEGNIIMFYIFSVCTSVMFFINPEDYSVFGEVPFLCLADISCRIFFSKKYNISGCWFK